MMQEDKALLLAREAIHRLEQHERTCAERWREVRATMRWVLGIVFTILLGLIAYLGDAVLSGVPPA